MKTIKIIFTSALFCAITVIAIYLPMKQLKQTAEMEQKASIKYQANHKKMITNNKAELQQRNKIREIENNIVHIGNLVTQINSINLKELNITNISYTAGSILINGSSKNFNTIAVYCKKLKSLKVTSKSSLVSIEYDSSNAVYNFNYKITL